MKTSDSSTYFLIGARRTGSTLLRVMLDSHPRIRFVRHWAIEMGLEYINEEGVAATNLEPYYWKLAGSYAFRESCIVIDRSLALPECLRDVLMQLQRSSSKPILGGAVHSNFPRLLFVCPDARFIYLYRDGRDVARSRMATGVARNYWTAAEPWMTAEDQAKNMRSDLPEGRWLEIRYEDLILRTRQTLTRICEFMGASYDEAIFEYMKRTRYTAPDPKLVDQWRHKMSPYEIRLAESRIGHMLEDRNYPLSGLPTLDVSATAARRFNKKGAWKSRLQRARQVGLGNFVAERLTRRLGMARLNSRISLHIDTQRQKTLR